MSNKIKKVINTKLFYFILGALIFGTIGVSAATYFESSAVTYDNTESGLQSKNVQGAIDELYNVCFPPGPLDGTIFEDKVVTSGDGLYEDEYEEGKYTYKGQNPNNYITFNNEEAGWRIISVEIDGTIKIMRTASIENRGWDSSSNDWATSDLSTYLNGTYYNRLNMTAKSQIVAKDWSIGSVTYDNNNLAIQITNENGTKWNGKVALVTVSEYLRSNSNKNSCETLNLYNSKYNDCKNTTWMYINDYWWTLSPYDGSPDFLFYVYSNGRVDGDYVAFYELAVRPVITLSSKVRITGGAGTQTDPYTIE